MPEEYCSTKGECARLMRERRLANLATGRAVGSGSGPWLGSNPDPDADPDNRQ